MSTEYFIAIPTDPRWVPDRTHEAAAVLAFDEMVPHRGELEVDRSDRVQFYSGGPNLETVGCQACGTVLAVNPQDMAWFVDQLDRCRTDTDGLWPLNVETPCCGLKTSLNDLTYTDPAGFASWAVSVRRPEIFDLNDDDRKRLEDTLGHSVRLIIAVL